MNTSSSSLTEYLIGEAAQQCGMSVDTLRYYEKIGLLRVDRSVSGQRVYTEKHLSTLNFIKRAKSMNFSLDEIARLLEMRADPQHAREEVRLLTQSKLSAIGHQIGQLQRLQAELQLLVNLCGGTQAGCPILQGLELEKDSRSDIHANKNELE